MREDPHYLLKKPFKMSASGSCYVDELLSLKCGGALLNLKLYPDMKELCESMAAWTHLRKYFSDEIAKPQKGDCLVVVGDGVKPRIGALCAFLARGWTCYSIDPQLQVSPNDARWVHDPAHKVSNLVCLRRKIQDVCIKANRVIFILMHAHVSLADTLLSVNATTEVLGVLSVPCCNNYEHQSLVWNQPPNFTFKDTQMLTERCEVRIWKNPRPLLIPPMRLVPCKNYSISDLRNHPVKKRALTLQSLASLAHFLKEHFSREDILIYHLNDPILSVLQEELLKGMEITACNILSEDPIDAKNYVVVDLLVMDFITAKYQINTCGRFVRALIGGAKSVVSVTMRDPVHLYRHVMSVSKVVCISEKSATQKFKMQFCVGRLLESFAQAVTPEVIVIKDHDMDSLISNSSRVYDILNLMESSRFAVDDQEVFSLCGVLSVSCSWQSAFLKCLCYSGMLILI